VKTSFLLYSTTTILAFLGTYFLKLGADNIEQYLAVVAVIFIDGFFGVWAGTKKIGFQTRKAVKVLQTLFAWVLILTGVLMIEKGFEGTFWLSETLCAPFIVFQLISALKNAHTVGIIENSVLSQILEKIDQHKFNHKENNENNKENEKD
jgi:phage-related holin